MPTFYHTCNSDWFLPSKDELAAMRTNLYAHEVGNFSGGEYWSSSEYNNSVVWRHQFSLDNQAIFYKYFLYVTSVRACRSFVAGVGAYSLRDTGPQKGLIFYIDGGTTYYEAARNDQSSEYIWSNIDDVEIGPAAQGTAIGTGKANTAAIIAQAGHTDSAAKLCDDYKT